MGSRSNKGLSAYIFKNNEIGTSSNNGISSNYTKVIIVSDFFEIDEVSEVDEESPAVVIIERKSEPFNDVIAVPRKLLAEKQHYMFGGSFIYTSDFRFTKISKQPIKLFDRIEG